MTEQIVRGSYPTPTELDAIASTLRMSAHFRRLRHTRRCRRCGAWLAVDQPSPDTCSPCPGAGSQATAATNGKDVMDDEPTMNDLIRGQLGKQPEPKDPAEEEDRPEPEPTTFNEEIRKRRTT